MDRNPKRRCIRQHQGFVVRSFVSCTLASIDAAPWCSRVLSFLTKQDVHIITLVSHALNAVQWPLRRLHMYDGAFYPTPSLSDRRRFSAAMMCCDEETVQSMIHSNPRCLTEDEGLNPDFPEPTSMTLIKHKPYTSAEFLERLITQYRSFMYLNKRNYYGYTLLHYAVLSNNSKLVLFLSFLDAVNINACSKSNGDTPLHVAVRGFKKSRALNIYTILTVRGANLAARNFCNETPKMLKDRLKSQDS